MLSRNFLSLCLNYFNSDISDAKLEFIWLISKRIIQKRTLFRVLSSYVSKDQSLFLGRKGL